MTDCFVSPIKKFSSQGILRSPSHEMPVWLGKNGISLDKQEGDGKTPVGIFSLRGFFWRPDRIGRPNTKLPGRPIHPLFGWCDAPEDHKYNQFVQLPYPASCESLWRTDHLYDLIIILGFNDAPPRPFAGSAVFMHVQNEKPTAGCVALSREDLVKFIEEVSIDTKLIISEC